ncbi:hypothetical protein GCM10027256_23370 [Novispirillum itersonii subsp. nipponicum]
MALGLFKQADLAALRQVKRGLREGGGGRGKGWGVRHRSLLKAGSGDGQRKKADWIKAEGGKGPPTSAGP